MAESLLYSPETIITLLIGYIAVQSLSHVWLFVTPWSAACRAPLSSTVFWSWLKFTSIESVMPHNHLIPHNQLLLLPSVFPSNRVFSSESALLIRWPKYWIFSISPSNEYSELISFRTNWFEIVLFHLSSALLYDGKESSCNAGDLGSIPGLGKFPGEGNGNPLQYSCLGNPMDRGARILEWVTTPSSRESSRPKDWTCIFSVSFIGRQVLYP